MAVRKYPHCSEGKFWCSKWAAAVLREGKLFPSSSWFLSSKANLSWQPIQVLVLTPKIRKLEFTKNWIRLNTASLTKIWVCYKFSCFLCHHWRGSVFNRRTVFNSMINNGANQSFAIASCTTRFLEFQFQTWKSWQNTVTIINQCCSLPSFLLSCYILHRWT